MKILAHYDGRMIVPDQPLDAGAGDELEIDVTVRRPPRPASSPAAILSVLECLPQLSQEAGDEFEESLARAKSPTRSDGVFDDLK